MHTYITYYDVYLSILKSLYLQYLIRLLNQPQNLYIKQVLLNLAILQFINVGESLLFTEITMAQ